MRRVFLAITLIGLLAAGSIARAEEVTVIRDQSLISLDRAIEIATEKNLDLTQARTELKISESKLKEARGAGGFSFKFSGNYIQTVNGTETSFPMTFYNAAGYATVSVTPGGAGVLSTPVASAVPTVVYYPMMKKLQKGASFVAEKPLWTFGKLRNNIRLNRIGMESSSLDVRRKVQDITYKVKQAYFQYLLAVEFLGVSEETVKQAQAHYDAAKARFDAGASPKFDVIRAEVDVAQAKENMSKARKGVDLARMALNNTMGIDINAETRVMNPENTEEITADREALVAKAFEIRPEISQIRLGQKQAALGSHMARMLPTIAFQGTYTMMNKGSTFGQEDAWQLVVAGEVPVFDSGSSHARVEQARRTREKLLQAEQQLKDGITLQVNEAWLSMNEAGARKASSAAILDQALEAVRMAEMGYKEGVTSNIDVIDAQHGLNLARLNNAQARCDFEVAKAKLLNAVGVAKAAELNAPKP